MRKDSKKCLYWNRYSEKHGSLTRSYMFFSQISKKKKKKSYDRVRREIMINIPRDFRFLARIACAKVKNNINNRLGSFSAEPVKYFIFFTRRIFKDIMLRNMHVSIESVNTETAINYRMYYNYQLSTKNRYRRWYTRIEVVRSHTPPPPPHRNDHSRHCKMAVVARLYRYRIGVGSVRTIKK